MTFDPDTQIEGDEGALEDLLATWFEKIESGEHPDLERHCSSHPHLKEQLAALLSQDLKILRSLSEGGTHETAESPLSKIHLEDFKIVRRIGTGGMGEVYVARQHSLGRFVAIKVLRPEHAHDALTRARFRREAEVVAALDHPHIVPIYASGESNGLLFLVMKLLPGKNLDEAAPLPVDEVARIGAKIASALHAAHRAGIVHRDVKPANILLVADHPYIVDFGLARGTTDLTLTRQGAVPGTLPYMAPEQLKESSHSLDARTDIYGLGASLYEIISGKPPFQDESPELLIRRILDSDPAPLQLRGRERDIESVILKALEKSPHNRFASMMELEQEFERYINRIPTRTRPISPISRVVRRAGRHPRVTAGAVIATILLALSLGMVVLDRRDRSRLAMSRLHAAEVLLSRRDWLNAAREIQAAENLEGPEKTIAQLRRVAKQQKELDEVIDMLQIPFDQIDADGLADFVNAIRSEPGSAIVDQRQRMARLIVNRLLGILPDETERQGETSLAREFPRAWAAVRALMDNRNVKEVLDTLPMDSASTHPSDDRAFSVIALRLQDHPPEVLLQELEPVLNNSFDNYRAVQAAYSAYATAGNLPAARMALIGQRYHDRHLPVVHLNLGWLNLREGKLEDALNELDAAEAIAKRQGQRPPTHAFEILKLDTLLAMKRFKDVEALLTEMNPDKQAKIPWISVIRGYLALNNGDAIAAEDHFKAAREKCPRGWFSNAAEISLLTVQLARCRREMKSELRSEQLMEIKRILSQATVLVERCEKAGLSQMKSEALVIAFQAQSLIDDGSDSISLLFEAGSLEQNTMTARLHLGMECVKILAGIERSSSGGQAGLDAHPMAIAFEARRILRSGIAAARSQRLVVNSESLVQALYADSELSRFLHDAGAVEASASAALELRPKTPEISTGIWERLERLLEAAESSSQRSQVQSPFK